MSAANVATEVNAFGMTFRRTVALTTDGAVIKNPTLAAAKTGALTTRTSDTVGVLTMDSGHGIGTGNRLDLYWDGGSRYGITVGTVSGVTVPLTSSGAGDVLPADETAITAMVPQLETFAVTAADMDALFVGCGAAQATAVFREADTTLVAAVETTGASGSYVWESTGGADTPFAEDVADVYLSHGDSARSWPVNVVAMVN
jgi:hypothetical protein